MEDVTRILGAIERGDVAGAEELLPLVYNELRRLAAQKLAREKPGQTLDATALVHEAYLRLLGPQGANVGWNGRAHFFAAAAEAMRRILINRARDKNRVKRGGGWKRVDLDHLAAVDQASDDDLIALDEALERLTSENPTCVELVKLRFFAGLTLEEAATSLAMGRRTADRHWAYARAYLYDALKPEDRPGRAGPTPPAIKRSREIPGTRAPRS
jgi:RNA polymerase sigma factor (TIGR02999 family)